MDNSEGIVRMPDLTVMAPRPPVDSLSDRELLEEMATNIREATDVIMQLVAQLAQNPLFRNMMG